MKILIQLLKIAVIVVVGVSLSYILTSCKDESIAQTGEVTVDLLTALPSVSRTVSDYKPETLRSSFGNNEIHNRFAQAYGAAGTRSLKESIIGYIAIEVDRLGEDMTEFNNCLAALPEPANDKSLPCKVELARFEGKDAWIFQFSHGTGDEVNGNVSFYAVDKSSNRLLYSTGTI